MEDQKLLTENITISAERLSEKSIEKAEPKRSLIVTATAVILIGISLLWHVSFIAEGIKSLQNKSSGLLLSVLIPEYEISEPLLPTPPESIPLKDGDAGEKSDKPEKSLFRTEDLSVKAEYGLALTNETAYRPDLYQLLGEIRTAETEGELDLKYSPDAPKVLIYHTHATESYRGTEGTGFRTEDEHQNMISVGEVITYVLEKAGIEAIHLTQQFDRDDWSASYENSNAAVRATLEKYPSIRYVFDVHRDCIGNDEEGYVRAATTVYGRDTAQLMFVCGTDEGGSGHGDWRKNLSFALSLQSSLFESHPTLMRAVNLRRASFYQDTSPQSLILECGTCASTLEEAKRGAVIFACALADYIKGTRADLDAKALIESICP